MKNIAASVVGTCVLSLSLGLAATARAAVVELTPDRDNTLFESGTGALSNGAGPSIFVGTTDAGLARRGILHWDIAGAVPAGATIEDVSLTLHLSRANTAEAQTIEVHRVLGDWGEGTSDSSVGGTNPGGLGATSTTGDATWLHRFFDTEAWINAGGDFDPIVSASADVIGIGNYTWSGEGLGIDVQHWLDVPSDNFGWLLLGNDIEARRFDSRESNDASLRPTLSITFSTEGGGGGGGGGAIPLPPAVLPGLALLALAGAIARYKSPTLARAIQPYRSPFSPRP